MSFVISSGSLPPFMLITMLGHLWPALCALILPCHFGLLEILISCLGLLRSDSVQASVIGVWSQQSFEGGAKSFRGNTEHFVKSQLLQLVGKTFR